MVLCIISGFPHLLSGRPGNKYAWNAKNSTHFVNLKVKLMDCVFLNPPNEEIGSFIQSSNHLRSPDKCKLEKILMMPPLSLTLSTRATYLCRVGRSADLQKSDYTN